MNWNEYNKTISNTSAPATKPGSSKPISWQSFNAQNIKQIKEEKKPMVTPTISGKPVLAMKPKTTQETISAAPEKKWPLGFIGEAAKAAYDTAKATIDDAANRLSEATQSIFAADKDTVERAKMNPLAPDYLKTQSTPLQRATKMGEAAVGTANIGFLPVTTQMEAAKKLPVIKYPASAASWGFEKLGEAGSYALGTVVDNLPVSQETKDTIKPLSEELGALITQIVGVKATHGVASKGLKLKALPFKETTKAKISTAAQLTAGFSMTPFSTAYGLSAGMIAAKVHDRQAKGIKITPEEGKKIIEEVKQELPKELENPEPIKETTPIEERSWEAFNEAIAPKKVTDQEIPSINKELQAASTIPPEIQPTEAIDTIARPTTKGFEDADINEYSRLITKKNLTKADTSKIQEYDQRLEQLPEAEKTAISDRIQEAVNESIKAGIEKPSQEFTDTDLENGYQGFKTLYNRFKAPKAREIFETGDLDSFKNYLESKGISRQSIDNLFYSQEMTGNEVYDLFRNRIRTEKKPVLPAKKPQKPASEIIIPKTEETPQKSRIEVVKEKALGQAKYMTGSQKEAHIKGVGMEFSAIKRQMEGNPTDIEFRNAENYLNSKHTGKEVEVNGEKVTLTGKQSFGKYQIKLADGTTKFAEGESIKSEKATRDQVIEHIKNEATKKLEGQERIFGIEYKEPVKTPEKPQEAITEAPAKETTKISPEPKLDSLNPTGSVFSNYSPEQRANTKLAENITTLDKTMDKSPDEMITIYRGTGQGNEIVPGDFITTNKQLAKDYAGTGNVLEKEVKLSDILDDKMEPLGEEYIYRPQKVEPIKTEIKAEYPLIQEAKGKSLEEFVNSFLNSTNARKRINTPRLTDYPDQAKLWLGKQTGIDYDYYGGLPEKITVYRAIPKDIPKYFDTEKLNPFDYVTAKKEMAEGFLKGDNVKHSKIISQEVPIKDLAFDDSGINEYGLIYKPADIKDYKSQLTDIWNKAQEKPAEAKIEKPTEPETPKETPEDKRFKSRVYERLQEEIPENMRDNVEYTRINQEKDIEKAIKLIKKDKNEAYAVAMGAKPAPEGQTATAVSIALAEKALDEGNYSLFAQLTKNRSLEQTRRGQEINAEKASISDNSTAKYVKQLISAKLDSLGKLTLPEKIKRGSAKEKALDKIDVEVKKAKELTKNKNLDLKEAQALIDKLMC